ncbi:hypothetical protein [Actinoplanes sp. NPDC026623]|uniref:hypothetical protein n=1 Tax=Actinoplanes sp. NPDC026623 TaxID=3155610 RepID=UPI00340BA50B
MALHGGLVGVAQDPDGALRPVAGWYLGPAEPHIDDVVDRIVRDHHTTAPTERRLFYASSDLAALYRRIGSATLFGGAWRLLPVAEHGILYRGAGPRSILTVIDLADGRRIGAALDDATQSMHWLVCRVEEGAEEGGGDISHLQTGRLDQIDGHDRTPIAYTMEPLRRPELPPLSHLGIDEQITLVRRAKDDAINRQDHEHVADLRAQEKDLIVKAGQARPGLRE